MQADRNGLSNLCGANSVSSVPWVAIFCISWTNRISIVSFVPWVAIFCISWTNHISIVSLLHQLDKPYRYSFFCALSCYLLHQLDKPCQYSFFCALSCYLLHQLDKPNQYNFFCALSWYLLHQLDKPYQYSSVVIIFITFSPVSLYTRSVTFKGCLFIRNAGMIPEE